MTRARTGEGGRRTTSGDTEVGFWALYAVLDLLRRRLLLPATGSLAAEWLPRPRGGLGRLRQSVASTANGMDSGTGRRRHSNTVRVVLETAFDPVAGGQEGVEALNQVRMAGKQLRNPANNSRSVDTVSRKMLGFSCDIRREG